MQNNFSLSYTPRLGNVGNPDQEQVVSLPAWAFHSLGWKKPLLWTGDFSKVGQRGVVSGEIRRFLYSVLLLVPQTV